MIQEMIGFTGHLGPVYEYVRFPAKWSSLAKNIARLRTAAPGAHQCRPSGD
jgi:hypothetical protein